MNNTNLYEETMAIIEREGVAVSDIQWVGTADGRYSISFDAFAALARAIDYDSGFGGAEVATDLVIVATDWWLTRGEYDGSEWWNFHQMPLCQSNAKPFTKMHGGSWDTIEGYGDDE